MGPPNVEYPISGRCDCGDLVYTMGAPPMATHACHCRWCQRQTGASFALHAMIELAQLKIVSGQAEEITVGSPSGAGQTITRCAKCHFAVWSVYLAMGVEAEVLRSVDVGTLDDPEACPPDFHIFTRHKQSWVNLSGDIPVFEQLYDPAEHWTPEQITRRKNASAIVAVKKNAGEAPSRNGA